MAGNVSSSGVMAATAPALGSQEACMSSASWITSSKVSLVSLVCAIPALTPEGKCFFHKAVTTAVQVSQSNSVPRSFTMSLANSLGLPAITLPRALFMASSGFGPKILSTSFLSLLYASFAGAKSVSFLVTA